MTQKKRYSIYGTALLIAIITPIAGFGLSPLTRYSIITLALAGAALVYRSHAYTDPPPAPSTKTLGLFITLITLIAICGQVAMYYISTLHTDNAHDAVRDAISNSPAAITLLYMFLIAPVCEEIIFRGVGYPLMRRKFSPWVAAITVSLVFALLHGNITQGATAFLISIPLCFLYEKTGRVTPGIAAHILANMCGTIAVAIVTGITG